MESSSALMALAALLFFKHLLADGPLQTRYQVAHKGEFLHPGGLIHAFIHAALTVVCACGWTIANAWSLTGDLILLYAVIGAAEFLIHYFCDLIKVRVDRRNSWSFTEVSDDGQAVLKITSSMYFIAFLVDQTVHSMTYLFIIYVIGIVL